MKVADVMESNVRFCGLDSTLESAAMIMWENNVASVPVLNHEGVPVGIVSDRDVAIAAALNHKPLWELTCGQITSDRPSFTVSADEDIRQALKTMWAQRLRRVPVVERTGQLRGILSVEDIVTNAERGTRGQRVPELSYDDAMNALKAVARTH